MGTSAALGPVSVGHLLWRYRQELWLTVVAKTTLTLVPDAVATLESPLPLRAVDVHHRGQLLSHVVAVADLIPRRDRVNVIVNGQAHASTPVTGSRVRLGVFRDDEPLLDKTLHVYANQGAPFRAMPIVYERAYGGIGHGDNPGGTGALEGDAPPNIVYPDGRRSVAGFGPLAAMFGARKRHSHPQLLLPFGHNVVDVPDDVDWAHYQVAPDDQLIAELRGDEWLVLLGMHPQHALLRTQLPKLTAAARVFGLSGEGHHDDVELRADTLHLEPELNRVSVVWRGRIHAPDAQLARGAQVVVGVETHGRMVTLPHAPVDVATRAVPTGSPTPESIEATSALSSTDHERAAATAPAPFPLAASGEASPKSDTASTPWSSEALSLGPAWTEVEVTLGIGDARTGYAEVAPPVMQSSPPAPVAGDVDTTMGGVAKPPGAALPFVATLESPAQGDSHVVPGAPWATGLARPVPKMSQRDLVEGTLLLAAGEQAPIEPSAVSPAVEGELIPDRAANQERLPVVAPPSLSVMTTHWRLRPPRDAFVVVLKASCNIVPGARSELRTEGSPISGDRFLNDDPNGSLAYPSDLAIFKPKADVIVHGRAYPPGGRGPATQVQFQFGDGAIDRRVAVFGDRRWQTGAMGEPVPFESMPLIYERAAGGRQHPTNPVGRDGSATTDGQRWLPNLEDPERLIVAPSDRRRPACLAAVSPHWPARRARLGTHDDAWLRKRWPHHPEDFDYRTFQAAPPEQQLDEVAGSERFRLVGMHREHSVIEGELPHQRGRCFVQNSAEAGGAFYEVVLRLDTVFFDVEAMRIDLVWRGLIEVADPFAMEIATLFATLEPLGADTSIETARAALTTALSLDEPVVTPNAPPTANDTPDLAEPDFDDARQKVEELLAQARDKLRAAGLPDELADVEPTEVAMPPPPPPLDELAKDELAERLRAAGVDEPTLNDVLRSLALSDVDEASRGGSRPGDDTSDKRAAVEERLKRGMSLDALDLSGADLSGLDLSGQSLRNTHLLRARLTATRFREADLRGAQLGGAELTDASFEAALLDGADFHGALLHAVSFVGASLAGANFNGATAVAADFSDCAGAQPFFAGANLERAKFVRADLPKALFASARLHGACFDGAQLTEARLFDAVAEGASFVGAVMAQVGVAGASLARCDFARVEAPRSVWDDCTLTDASFVGAVMPHAGFMRASCIGADFAGAELSGARFRRAKLNAVAFQKANLMEAGLRSADLRHADLRGANLYGAELQEADTAEARLQGAITTNTKLRPND